MGLVLFSRLPHAPPARLASKRSCTGSSRSASGLGTFVSATQVEPRPEREICPCRTRELRRWGQPDFHVYPPLQPSRGSLSPGPLWRSRAGPGDLVQVVPHPGGTTDVVSPIVRHEARDSSPVRLEPASTTPIQQSQRAAPGALLEMPPGLMGCFFLLFSKVCGRGGRGGG